MLSIHSLHAHKCPLLVQKHHWKSLDIWGGRTITKIYTYRLFAYNYKEINYNYNKDNEKYLTRLKKWLNCECNREMRIPYQSWHKVSSISQNGRIISSLCNMFLWSCDMDTKYTSSHHFPRVWNNYLRSEHYFMIMQKWSYYAKINSNFQLRYTKNRHLNRFFFFQLRWQNVNDVMCWLV